MADSSLVEIKSVVSLGPILGTAVVIPDAKTNLISPSHMISNGYDLHFTKSGAGVFHNSQLVHKGQLDPSTNLFTINLADLIAPSHLDPNLSVPSFLSTHSASTSSLTARKTLDILWLHKRLGHPSRSTMIKAVKNNAWQNIPPSITAQDINTVFSHIQCTACALGKRNKLPVASGSGIHPLTPGHTISFDYQPVTTKSVTGHTGYFLFKCLFSGFRYSAFVTSKSASTLISSFDIVRSFFAAHGHIVVKARCDSGSSELSADFKSYLLKHNII